MVRRILPDSDFESDDEPATQSIELASLDDEAPAPVSAPCSPRECSPRSRRRVIRKTNLVPRDMGTYDYNSDIYTDESSMASFIVDDGDDHVYAGSDISGILDLFKYG